MSVTSGDIMNRNDSQPSLLNSSPSKALFSFSKEERFKNKSPVIGIHAYDINSKLGSDRGDGRKSPFGSSVNSRFDYLGAKKANMLPPSTKYDIKGTFGEDK